VSKHTKLNVIKLNIGILRHEDTPDDPISVAKALCDLHFLS